MASILLESLEDKVLTNCTKLANRSLGALSMWHLCCIGASAEHNIKERIVDGTWCVVYQSNDTSESRYRKYSSSYESLLPNIMSWNFHVSIVIDLQLRYSKMEVYKWYTSIINRTRLAMMDGNFCFLYTINSNTFKKTYVKHSRDIICINIHTIIINISTI